MPNATCAPDIRQSTLDYRAAKARIAEFVSIYDIHELGAVGGLLWRSPIDTHSYRRQYLFPPQTSSGQHESASLGDG